MISTFLFLVSTEVDQGCCNLAWLELIKTSLSSIKRRQVWIWWSHFIPASSLFLWIFMFSTRDQEVWGPLGNQSIFPPICLCLSSPNLICSAHFLRAIFWITSSIMLFLAVYKKKNKTRAKCLVWYSGAQQSFINLLYSAFFTNCYCIWIILPAFPKYDLCFSPSSPWSCYLCFLECLFVQYQLKFTHSPCPPPNPTFLMKTHWPPHLQNYPD